MGFVGVCSFFFFFFFKTISFPSFCIFLHICCYFIRLISFAFSFELKRSLCACVFMHTCVPTLVKIRCHFLEKDPNWPGND